MLDLVSTALKRLAPVAGTAGMSPADVRSAVMSTGETIAAWEVRGALSELEQRGSVALNADSGRWFLTEGS